MNDPSPAQILALIAFAIALCNFIYQFYVRNKRNKRGKNANPGVEAVEAKIASSRYLIVSTILLSLISYFAASALLQPPLAPEKDPVTKQSGSNEPDKRDVREIVWEQLSPSQKESLSGGWKDAKISKIIFRSSMGSIENKSYEGKEVIMIDYPTERSAPDNMIVYADVDTYEYIGTGFVE